MLSFVRTTEYELEQFSLCAMNENVDEAHLKKAGFKKTGDGYVFIKNRKSAKIFFVLESENVTNAFPIAAAIKEFLDFYHILHAGILLGSRIIIEEYFCNKENTDIMYLFLDDGDEIFMPYDNVFMGKCNFMISPYPGIDDSQRNTLRMIARDCGLVVDDAEEMKGTEYFSELTALERKLLDFSQKTERFDLDSGTITRVQVVDITLPVVSNEYYTDLFAFLKRKSGKNEYNGGAGNVLSKNCGVFVCAGIKNEKNMQSLYRCVKTFVEDING
jgi:hypothetical protein